MSKLITKELQNKADYIIKSGDYNIVNLSIDNRVCIYIGSVRVYGYGPKSTYIYLDEDLGKKYMIDWKNDVGQVLVNCFRKSNIDRLYVLSNDNDRFLIYRISEDELDEFKDKGFVHLKIADMKYTILRYSTLDYDFSNKDNFVHEELPEEDKSKDDEEMQKLEEEEQEEQEEESLESYSLFE